MLTESLSTLNELKCSRVMPQYFSNGFRWIGAIRHKFMDGGLGQEPTSEFVLGTRAYNAHICLHVNATASHAIARSYTNISKSFDGLPQKIARIGTIPNHSDSYRWKLEVERMGT
ncbi:hypothetical protein QEV83_05120 [Methylocapsa sp. D3K7]|uniref:hypothetical protein n=1 Tax=Methylocapsa sp. D3K7 TaxID=3041435 RepID=UPI00244E784C|nr:hypothetical protein [Methylocapsa sp. D3K7]WGJ15648.1 hypothetical protein QEV83_05120 [Methylocapsa sp. D3K7]